MATGEERRTFSTSLDRASAAVIVLTYHTEEHTRRLEERIDHMLSLMRTLAHEHQGQSSAEDRH